MNSKLFAFRVARPIESTGETPLEFTYDPQSQTSVWSGSGAALAFYHCTSTGGRFSFCNAYGNYCNATGRGTKKCDT
jgi:hypothetical protein